MTDAPRLSPEQQAEAVACVRAGQSQRAVGKRFGVSQPTIAKYLERAPAALPASRTGAFERRPPATQPDDAPPADNAPAITQARFLLAEAREQIRRANAIGDGQLSQRQTRNASYLTNMLAKLEKVEAQGSDTFSIPRAEIDATMVRLTQRIKTITSRPLLCAGCSRSLSVAWGNAEHKQ
jgi:hypothetical protein